MIRVLVPRLCLRRHCSLREQGFFHIAGAVQQTINGTYLRVEIGYEFPEIAAVCGLSSGHDNVCFFRSKVQVVGPCCRTLNGDSFCR